MSTIKCPQCNLVNWATAVQCKRCAFQFQSVDAPRSQAAPAMSGNYAAQNFDNFEASGNSPEAVYQKYSDSFDSRSSYQQNTQFSGQSGYQNRYQNNYQNNYQAYNNYDKPKIKLSVISMVCGILGFPPISSFLAVILIAILGIAFGTAGAMFGLAVAFSVIPVALITGIVALIRANKRPHEYGGKGFAIAGIVLSGLEIVAIPLIAAIAIPNLLAARRSANEASAIATVRRLSDAESKYMSSMQNTCGSMETLISMGLVDKTLSTNEKSGYRFEVVDGPNDCEIHAFPSVSQGVTATGNRSFYTSSTDAWKIRVSERNGSRAGKSDKLLENFVR